MYSSCSTLLLGPRGAKGSFSHHYHHVYISNDRKTENGGRCCCGGGGLLMETALLLPSSSSSCAPAAVSAAVHVNNPRFLLLYGYWLRQSTLIRWSSPSSSSSRSRRKSLISGGGPVVAATALPPQQYSRRQQLMSSACEFGGGGGLLGPPPSTRETTGWRRRRCWRRQCGDGVRRIACHQDPRSEDNDGSFFEEMVGILEEAEEDCWREHVAGRRTTGGFFDHKYRRDSRQDDDDDCDVLQGSTSRLSSSSSSYYSSAPSSSSSLSSGDSGSYLGFPTRATDASFSGHSKQGDDISSRESQKFRKYEDEAQAGRRSYGLESRFGQESGGLGRESKLGELEKNAASSVDLAHQGREEYARKDRRVAGQRTLQFHGSGTTERASSSRKQFEVKREETSTVSVELLEEVRRQRIELEQLRKVYQELLRATEAHSSGAVRESSSTKVPKLRLVDSEECDTSAFLLEEVRRQCSEIDQLRKSYQKLRRALEILESDIERVSSSKKATNRRLEDREESSKSAPSLTEEAGEGEQCNYKGQKIMEHADSKIDYQKLAEIDQLRKDHQRLMRTSEINESDTVKVSSSRVINARLKASPVNVAEEVSVRSSNIDQQLVGSADPIGSQKLTEAVQVRKKHQKPTKMSGIYESDSERIPSSDMPGNTRSANRKVSSASDVNFVEEMREQHSNTVQQIVGSVDRRRSSQKLTEIVEIHKSNIEDPSRSQRCPENNSTSVQDLVQMPRKKRSEAEHQVVDNLDESNQSHILINVSEIHRGETTSSKRVVMSTMNDREDGLASVDGQRDQWFEVGKQVTEQLRSRQDSQKNTKMWQLIQSDSEKSSTSLKSSNTSINRGDDSSSVLLPEANEKKKANLVGEKVSLEMSLEASSGSSDGGSGSVYTDTHILDDRATLDELHLVKADALGSASRLDKSSSQYVGEFVDQLHQELSASEQLNIAPTHFSENQMESDQVLALEKHVLDSTGKHKVKKFEEEGPRQSSATSDVRGPSDEVWDVRGQSSREPPAGEPKKDSSDVRALESTGTPTNNGNAIVKRSSKSLWNYIADVVRLGWRPRTESHQSTLQSGTRSSSNESVSSDIWFSGHEPDDDEEENARKGKRAEQKETVVIKRPVDRSQLRTSAAPCQAPSEATRLEDKITQVVDDVPILVGTNSSADATLGSSLAPQVENLQFEETERQGIHSSVVTAGPSVLLETTSVPIYEKDTSIDTSQVQEDGFIKSQKEKIMEMITEVDENEGRDGNMRHRKLQRNKQVLKEQFDEWEEAYKLEKEQRKTDEFFMREALLEAKKAADMWEVPVGAVLVQDGRVIARGCNLVEELRDSTAHAEMICIREASNLLRTWRLAETTLYVTLEPCAMCAGAILQARIDAVVWGSPNKLLGADGSWVRLFPGGDEGKSNLDQSSQTAGPVHPFHPKIAIRRGVLATECADAMQQFFQLRRKNNKKESPPPSCLPINYPAKLLTKMHDIFCVMSCM